MTLLAAAPSPLWYADRATGPPEGRAKQADLRGTVSEARQGFAQRDRFVDGRGRRLPSLRFHRVPIGA